MGLLSHAERGREQHPCCSSRPATLQMQYDVQARSQLITGCPPPPRELGSHPSQMQALGIIHAEHQQVLLPQQEPLPRPSKDISRPKFWHHCPILTIPNPSPTMQTYPLHNLHSIFKRSLELQPHPTQQSKLHITSQNCTQIKALPALPT